MAELLLNMLANPRRTQSLIKALLMTAVGAAGGVLMYLNPHESTALAGPAQPNGKMAAKQPAINLCQATVPAEDEKEIFFMNCGGIW